MEFFRIHKDIPFMRHALVFNLVSAVTFALAVFFLVTKGLHLSVEFTGGTVVEVAYSQPAQIDKVRGAVEKLGYKDVLVQNFGSSRDVMIRLPLQKGVSSSQQSGNLMAALKAQSPDVALRRVEFVGPQVGEELMGNGLKALGFVVLGIIIYLAVRFEWKYAVSAIIANLHDVVIILGFFAFFQWEFSLAVLAAVLAVLGYSVNESVVIFDLMREASNCSQLRRNFEGSTLLVVPEVYWDWCTPSVMVMERMRGIPISQRDALITAGIDLTALSRAGVEIFFTQVFRDGFFHADMHPGNIFVATDDKNRGKYIALDFGIVGTLTDRDKNYLAQNFLAFFQRDYKRVAMTHVEAGWAPADTRVDEFEAAIRAVCEPIFDRPLSEISFGRVLLRLFQTSRRFNVEIQPQLVMLQKTLLNIEGLGRELDPNLDLWTTAKPFLERWMKEQLGWRAFSRNLKQEMSDWARILPQMPRLLHQTLSRPTATELAPALTKLTKVQRQQNRLLAVIALLLAASVALHFL